MRNNCIDANARGGRVVFVTVIAAAAMGASAAAGAWVQSYLVKRPALTADQERAIAEQASRDSAYVRENVNLLASKVGDLQAKLIRSEEHTSELQSLMRISYAVFCLKKKKQTNTTSTT